MTPEDRALLKAAGLKPEGYVSAGNKFYAVPAEPEPTTPTTPELTSTTKGAFGRAAAANTVPALVGIAAGAVVGSALTATGVGAPIGLPLLGAAAAGAGAAYGASKLQEPLLSDEFRQQLAADQEQHPIASALGGAAPNLISARPTGLTQLAKAGRGILGSVDPVARAAAKELAINTGVNVGTGMGMRALTDQDVTDGIGLDAALGVLMGGKPHTSGIGGKFNRGVDALSEAAHNVTPSLTSKPKAPFVGLTTQGSTEEELAGLIAAAQADRKPAFEAAPAPVNLEARAKLFTGEDIPQPAYSDSELKQYLKDITAAATKAGGPPTADELATAKNNWIARKEAEAATKAAVNRATNLGEVEPLATVGLKPELADYYPGALNKLRRIVKEGAKQNTSYTLEEQQMLLERMATNEAIKADTAASKLKQTEFEKANKELAKAEKAQAKLEAEAYKARDEQKQRELDALQVEAEKQNAIREANAKKILDDEIRARNEEFAAGQTETGNFLREAFDAELKPKLDNAGVSQLDRIYAESRIGVPEGMKSMLDAIYANYKAERVPEKTLEVARANLAESQAQPEQVVGATESNWQKLKRNELLRQQVADENAALAATGEPADVPAKQQDAPKTAQAMQDRLRLEREVLAENKEPALPRVDTSKSKIREVPSWMDRTSESVEAAPPIAEDQSLTQGMYDLVANFYAPRLGIKVRKSHRPVNDEGVSIPKGVIIDNKDVAVTPKATQDTIFHEALGHGFMNMARTEDGTALRKQADRLVELAANDSKYLAWKAEAEKRIDAGKLSRGFDTSPEEYVAQVFGVRLAKDLSGERYVSPKLKYQTDLLFKELKRVMGKASADDMFSLIQEAMVNGATPRGKAVGTAYQLDRSDREVREAKRIAQETKTNYEQPNSADEEAAATYAKIKDEQPYPGQRLTDTEAEEWLKTLDANHVHDPIFIMDLKERHPDVFSFYEKYFPLVVSQGNKTLLKDSERAYYGSKAYSAVLDSSTHKLNAFEKTRYEKQLDASLGTKEERATLIARAKEAGFIPVPVWHGSTEKFHAFDPGALGSSTKATSATLGHFFSSNSKDAANYGNPKAYFLKAEKPFVYDMRGQAWGQDSQITNRIKKAFDGGHDVVVFKNFRDPGGKYGEPATHYVVKAGLENHIKSAEAMTDNINSKKSKGDLLEERKRINLWMSDKLEYLADSTLSDAAKKRARLMIKGFKQRLVEIQNELRDSIPLSSRFDTSTTDTRYSEEGAPEVPYKSNIARMVEGMKQEKFTKGQLEAEIRKNRSTIEEYDYRGLSKDLPEKLDKATVLKAVKGVAPRIERVNFTDKTSADDVFSEAGATRQELIKLLTPEAQKSYQNDPARWESKLKISAAEIAATKASGFIDTGSNEITRLYFIKNGLIPDANYASVRDYNNSKFVDEHGINEAVRVYDQKYNALAKENPSALQYDPNADERIAPYWTSNPNRSETTLKIPDADYVGKPRSKEHFSNDTFGWIRTSEGKLANGTPVKIGEEFQSDVTKYFRRRNERDEELIRRGDVAQNTLVKGSYENKTSENEQKNIAGFLLGGVEKGETIDAKTLSTTPYLKSESRLLLKQLLLEAERDGFNHIAWTTGDEQANRNRREGIEDRKIGWKYETNSKLTGNKDDAGVILHIGDKEIDTQSLSRVRQWDQNKTEDTYWSRLGIKPDQISEILARIKRGETSGTIEVNPAEGYHNIYDREVVAEAKRLGLKPTLQQMSDGTIRWVAEITPKAREESRYAFSEEGAPRISSLSSIIDSPGGAYVEEKLRYAQRDNNALNGKYLNQALKILLNAKNPDLIYKALIARRHGEAGPTLSAGQEMVANRVRALLTSIHDEQRSRGLLVQDYENGKPVFREAKDDPNYIYEVPSAKVYDTLTNRPESPEAKKLVQDFIDFKTEQYGSKEAAQEALDRMIPRKGGGPRLEYNAARLSEGAGLPASWRETDFVNATRRYFNRMAADLAYYKNIQSDPVMRQLLNIKSDGTGENAPKATKLGEADISNVDYSNHPDVIGALEDMMGGRNLMPINAHAINRLAKTLMIGIPGKLRDFATSPFIAMETGVSLKHLPKALANLSEGMNEVINRGLADVGRDAWFNDTLNDAGTFAERVNKIADQAGAIQGLPQLEQATRGLTWLLGKYTAQSKLGDKTFMKQWGPKEAMSTEDTVKFIADRITESVQGTYDFQSVPTWMRNSSLGSVFALSKWSVGRYKNFQEHVLRPAKSGDLKPLLTAGLGIFMGSAAIDALNELIKDKKPEHLTWDEWLKLGMPETGYKLATAVSSSGVAGILGDLALNVYQKSTGKSSQEFGIPVIGLAEKLATRVGQMAEAESLDLPKLIHLIAKDNIQTYRDTVSGFEPDETNAKRDFRVYDRITNDRSSQFKPSNPFLDRASEMTPAEFANSKIKNPGSAMMIYDRRNPEQYNKFLTAIGEGDQAEKRAVKQYLEDEKERGRRMVRR